MHQVADEPTGLMVARGWHSQGPACFWGLSIAVLPAILLFGSVIREGTRITVAAAHLLDRVVKLGIIVGLFV